MGGVRSTARVGAQERTTGSLPWSQSFRGGCEDRRGAASAPNAKLLADPVAFIRGVFRSSGTRLDERRKVRQNRGPRCAAPAATQIERQETSPQHQ